MPGSGGGSGRQRSNREIQDLSGACEATAAAVSPFEDAIDGASKLDRVEESLSRQPLASELETRFNTEPQAVRKGIEFQSVTRSN